MNLSLITFGLLLFSGGFASTAQTLIKLSSINPGTESVQLIGNGDFQDSIAVSGDSQIAGWSSQGQLVAGKGTNTVLVNDGSVACAKANLAAPVSSLQRTVILEPNTSYILSAYLWNMGDSTDHVTTVIDFNDAPGEPQIVLTQADPGADLGYFGYRGFNTAVTGTNITLRVFYDGFTGTGAAARYYPIAAQWDNVAITKATEFVPPLPPAPGENLRPHVRITTPADGTNLFLASVPGSTRIEANAWDYDGTISKVQFFADSTPIGTSLTQPFFIEWTNIAAGPHVLTAIAHDNHGAATTSAPLNIVVTTPPPPVALKISQSETNVTVSWPVPTIAMVLQTATNLHPIAQWQAETNEPILAIDRYHLSFTGAEPQRFFRLGPDVSSASLDHKLMFGYQGWFGCPNDGSAPNRWVHWFRRQNANATNATVDFLPDVSELAPDELYPTQMTLTNGKPVMVYSAFNQKTVVRHFQWMKENHLDGVFLQRFSSELSSPALFEVRNRVTENVRVGAETHGRVFAIMYDISGQSQATLVQALTNDWTYLTGNLHITNSPSYVQHNGKPVVAIWGFGFTDRNGSPDDAMAVIQFFKNAGCTVMGGVPTYWRTLKQDSKTNAAWAGVYRSFDIISPWAVGRYGNAGDADAFKQNLIVPDLADAKSHHIDYMPVIFPGFSWHNLQGGELNQIPRNGGAFYWRQAYNAISAGCAMIYGAMFDEMDEGTAMLKVIPTAGQLPVQGTFVPLDIDGQTLPSDWYLRLGGEATKMLRGDIPLSPQIPITP